MTRPSKSRLKVKVRLSASVAAASCVAPSQPMRSTSVAWMICWVGCEDQRPGERKHRAQLIAHTRPSPVSVKFSPSCMEARLAVRRPVEKLWPVASLSASAGRQPFEALS